MNNFTLKFFNPELELQYQNEKIQKIRKRVFYLFMALGLILNITKVILDILELKPFTQYINYALVGLIIVLVPISIRWPIHIRYTLMVANISTALLQMNFTESTKAQMYYSYGSNFTQFQTCAYFVSDFLDSIVQVTCHTLIKTSITIYVTNTVDPQDILMSVGAGIIISSVIYSCDSHSRKEFLQNVSENIWDQQLPEIIKKPYFQVTYNKTLLQFNVLSWNDIELFPSFCDSICKGCNVRNFLRIYKCNEKELGQMLQHVTTGTIKTNNGKQKFKLRIINIGVDYTNKIVILDNTLTHHSDRTLMTQIKQTMNLYIKQSSNKIHQSFFNWGMMSLLLINDFTIQEIQLCKLIKKLNAIYQKQKQFHFFIKGDQSIVFKGYINLIRIYLIQVYFILTQVSESQEKKKRHKTENKPIPIFITIYKEPDTVCLQLPPTTNYILFISKYTNNIFINQIEQTILAAPLSNNLKINFNTCVPFKKI